MKIIAAVYTATDVCVNPTFKVLSAESAREDITTSPFVKVSV